MKNSRLGTYREYRTGEEVYRAYNPPPLPPVPGIDMSPFYALLDDANAALGRLDGMKSLLPNVELFLHMYVRKEAVLSSQIEGTQSSLSDLLLFEINEVPGIPIDDVKEVSRYVDALSFGLARLKEFPLSLRLIKEIHNVLMTNARGKQNRPGEFRASQNWIGGTRPGNATYVPPNPESLMAHLADFESFLHDESQQFPLLIKVALMHVQFESIHPFLDGNGRLGRLLITLILCHKGILSEPLLYLSLYLKENRATYYKLLQNVRETGDWESWVHFFLTGVLETAKEATRTAQNLLKQFDIDKNRLIQNGHYSPSVQALFDAIKAQPIVNTSTLVTLTDLSRPTVLRGVTLLQDQGILSEITGKQRHRVYVYDGCFQIIGA